MVFTPRAERVARKLKRERVIVCLNCKRFDRCNDIGNFEECASFEKTGCEAWRDETLAAFVGCQEFSY